MSQPLESSTPSAVPSRTIIEQFHRQVDKTPEALAIVFEGLQLSFKQLDELATQFAQAMIDVGIRAGDTVGLCIDRCPEAIAAMLGAFKISAVYVPLDPEYPVERVQYMIEDADLKAIITHDLNNNALAKQLIASQNTGTTNRCGLPWIDSGSQAFREITKQACLRLPNPNDLAYIMYTSGSTGMPKGVQIEHVALTTYCDADRQIYELTPADRTLQFSTLNFDIAIEEIFPPLLAGGSVVIRPRHRSESSNELSCIIDRYQVTAIHIATAYWHEWVDLMVASKCEVPKSLRLVIATGEKISVEHYRRWQSICKQEVKWCNAYGPTETTVTCTVFIPDAAFDQEHMPIGKPLPGYQAYILDEQNRPLGLGETGQLFIGGPALARGYHNNPQKTSAAFLEVDLPNQGLTRIYRTGDLARWLPSGDIEFAGRVDHQIKVGSYRIEPGEIEVAIAKFAGVLESIVIHEEIGSQKFLIAYVAVGSNVIDLPSLQQHLRSTLPAYMIPPRYVLLPSLPKTINGKIDRKSLPSPLTSQAVTNAESAARCDAVVSDVEAKMIEIWKSVLHYPSIQLSDDFFLLGGSSLLVTRVVAAVATQFEIELPVRDFFANPTVESIARHLEHLIAIKEGRSPTALMEGSVSLQNRNRLPRLFAKMLPLQEGNLFTVRYQPKSNRRNHCVLICNTLGHEQARAYRNLQQLSVSLSEQGFEVLRFDYRGTGNSSHSCEWLTASSMQEDTRTAAAYLRHVTEISRLSLIGIRLGATIAATSKVPDVDHLVLWDPITEGADFLLQLDRLHDEALTSQTRFVRQMRRVGADQAYGHALSSEKRHSLAALRMPASLDSHCRHAEILLSSGEHDLSGHMGTSDGTRIVPLVDQIHWDELAYTESAFSSPNAYSEITRILNQPIDTEPVLTPSAMPSLDLACFGLEVQTL